MQHALACGVAVLVAIIFAAASKGISARRGCALAERVEVEPPLSASVSSAASVGSPSGRQRGSPIVGREELRVVAEHRGLEQRAQRSVAWQIRSAAAVQPQAALGLRSRRR